MNLSRFTLYKWENGTTTPTLNKLSQLAGILDVPINIISDLEVEYEHVREKQQIKGPSGNLIKIEIFVHGALCMAVSGKCYMSLHTTNSSANRGACIQNCRKTYTVTDKEDGHQFDIDNEYIMSPKDLCTIGFLDCVAQK